MGLARQLSTSLAADIGQRKGSAQNNGITYRRRELSGYRQLEIFGLLEAIQQHTDSQIFTRFRQQGSHVTPTMTR